MAIFKQIVQRARQVIARAPITRAVQVAAPVFRKAPSIIREATKIVARRAVEPPKSVRRGPSLIDVIKKRVSDQRKPTFVSSLPTQRTMPIPLRFRPRESFIPPETQVISEAIEPEVIEEAVEPEEIEEAIELDDEEIEDAEEVEEF